MAKKIWAFLFFLGFNIVIGMPGLFLFIASLYTQIGKVGLIVEIIIALVGNYLFIKKKPPINKLIYGVLAILFVVASAFIFSRPLFGFS